jgi:frataxin-like iron-binding protein CyaY
MYPVDNQVLKKPRRDFLEQGLKENPVSRWSLLWYLFATKVCMSLSLIVNFEQYSHLQLPFLSALSDILSSTDYSKEVRAAAGFQIRNTFTAKTVNKKHHLHQLWLSYPKKARNYIKTNVSNNVDERKKLDFQNKVMYEVKNLFEESILF